jgi:hypothetical protein
LKKTEASWVNARPPSHLGERCVWGAGPNPLTRSTLRHADELFVRLCSNRSWCQEAVAPSERCRPKQQRARHPRARPRQRDPEVAASVHERPAVSPPAAAPSEGHAQRPRFPSETAVAERARAVETEREPRREQAAAARYCCTWARHQLRADAIPSTVTADGRSRRTPPSTGWSPPRPPGPALAPAGRNCITARVG